MLAAINSKGEKYDPVKWMQDGREIKRKAAAERANREAPTGDQILAQLKAAGVPVIDRRRKKTQ